MAVKDDSMLYAQAGNALLEGVLRKHEISRAASAEAQAWLTDLIESCFSKSEHLLALTPEGAKALREDAEVTT